MTSTLKTALVLLALGSSTIPAVAQDRLPRAGAPTATVVVTETAPDARRPRSGAPVAVTLPASTELVVVSGSVADSIPGATELGRCGRKYCGSVAGR